MKRFVIFLVCLIMLQPYAVWAEEIPETNYGYISPEMIQIIPGEDSSSVVEKTPPKYYGTINLPERFDAREEGIIHYSGLGQKGDNTCWTFASALCTETALGGNVNLSEQHLKYASSNIGNNPYGYKRLPTDGGNFHMYTAYASNWRGPVLEADDPYEYGYEERDYDLITSKKPVAYHLQGTINIPNPAEHPSELSADEKAAHLEEVKYYVYKYKCLFSSIYWQASNYNQETSSYYSPQNNTSPNHAINIIGWDDNYPKENFNTKPKNNGAFIVKNSHGITGGYLYLSYEDTFAGWETGAVTLVEDKYNYGEIYTHEYFEPCAYAGPNTNIAKTTNVFTSKYDGEYVSAVGVVTLSRNLNYKVYVSKTAEGKAYNEDDYTLCGEGRLDMPGYHTLKLATPFPLGDKGTKYCVRVIYTPDDNIKIPLEFKNGLILDSYAQEGESYLAFGNNVWGTDTGKELNSSLYVRAFTDAEYDIKFETGNAKYSINGSEVKPGEDTTAGLNDEITLEFTNLTSTYSVNGTEYEADTKVTIKVTEDLMITENHSANVKTEFENESLTLDTITHSEDTYSVSITPEFETEKTVVVAYFNLHKLIGVKTEKISSNVPTTIETKVSGTPDDVKILVVDSIASLNTKLGAIDYILKK